jgi:hypothetical protein
MPAHTPVLDILIGEILAEPAERFLLPHRTAVQSQANARFAAIVHGALD